MHRPRTLLAAVVLAIPLILVPASPALAATYTPTNWSQLQTDVSAATTSDLVALGANITAPAGQRLEVAPGETLNLDLNGFSLTIPAAPNEQAAIRVPSTAHIAITATGGGTLTAISGSSGAGIGGDQHEDAGTVTIHDGTINATASGPGGGAGIGGGGAGGAGGTVFIHGGVVTATSAGGEVGGAGIGGAQASPGGIVTITGGVVVATGGNGSPGVGAGAGIGGGGSIGLFMDGGTGATVTITGGSVTATGGTSPGTQGGGGAGIGGGGGGALSSGGAGSSVSIVAPPTPGSHTTGGSGASASLGGLAAALIALTSPPVDYFHSAVAVNGTQDGPAASVSIDFRLLVTFDSDGGTPVADQYVEVGGFASVPTPPTRAGFEFDGWRVGGAMGPAWDGTASVTSPLTLVATWRVVDFSALRALVENALTDELSYTPATWGVYASALAAAETVLDDPTATQAEVDAAHGDLIDAEAQLAPRADFTELEQVIGLAEGLPANGSGGAEFDYDAWGGLGEAYDELQTELGEGRDVFDDKNSTQVDVDTAAAQLRQKVYQVEAGVALAETVIEIDELDLTESGYTPGSWAALLGALGDANTALGAIPLLDSALLDELQGALRDAWSALEAAPQGDQLPFTGAESAPFVLAGMLLLLLGGGVLVLNVRRRESALPE